MSSYPKTSHPATDLPCRSLRFPIQRFLPAALGLLVAAAAGQVTAANISAPGVPILGVNANIDATLGQLRFNSGAATNIIDGNLTTRVDNFLGSDARAVSFVGVIWFGKHYESISTISLTLATFGDGGWFGVPGALPPTGGALAATNLIEPTVQVTTDRGSNWVTVASTSDYQTVMLNHQIGGTGGQPNPSTKTSTFTLTTPATQINGIRIIGTNGGRAGADTNGFLGVFDFAVNATGVDADTDGMDDTWETAFAVDDPADDPDFDGLSNLGEFINFSNPTVFDTDGDQLADGDEVGTYLTRPAVADTDGDGLTDGAEVDMHFTNPLVVDTDGDTLSDGAEVNTYNTNPLSTDTDGDLFTDRQEVLFGGNPSNPLFFPDNLALAGSGIIGVKASIATGPDEPYSQQASTTWVNINDGNLTTRLDTWNNAGVQTCSYVGVTWPFTVTNQVSDVVLTMATFGDGGWFGVNTVGPGAGGFLSAAHLTEPVLQVSTDRGTNWTTVAMTSDYTNRLTGHRIGGGGNVNPSTVTVTFTLTTPTANINAIRLLGTEGGTASRGFLGVFEFMARKAVSDSDADGMSDTWELANGLVVGTNDAALDADSDGLTNIGEFTRDTNPQVADTDGDGLNDGPEVTVHLTSPTRPDTDGDGLNDGPEVNTYASNPLVRDTDGDGYLDGVEASQGTSPTSAASTPSNLALISSASGILGTKAAFDGLPGTLVFNAGGAASINDGNLTTRVDSYAANGQPLSFTGIIWSNAVTAPIVRLELTLATFFDGGWFGPNGSGPGSGGVLGPAYLSEPIVQVSSNSGVSWVTVPHASDYLTKLNNHPLPTVDFGPPTAPTAHFIFIEPPVGITGVRILGTEGGTASGGFLGVFELAARNMVADTDGDGMNDEWEGFFGLNVGANDAAGDGDGDGLSNLLEFRNNAKPTVADTDGDGLNDGAEINTHNTSPTKTDSDGDGLGDFAEVNTHGTNPALADTDGDGFADGMELARSTDPLLASSHPSNYALVGSGILGTKAAVDATLGNLVFNAGLPANINDENLTTRVDSFAVDGNTYSFVGIIWPRPYTNVTGLELTLATFFDGGWFGVNGSGPGSGASLSSAYLLEPSVQITRDGGTNWSVVPHGSDYLTALNGHLLPSVDFGPPTTATSTFRLVAGQTNINGIRIIGKEGGPAGGGFLGVFELKVELDGKLTPQIINITIGPGPIQFQFNSQAGVIYDVQYKDELTDPTWQTLTTIPGDGTLKTFTAAAGPSHRFYRVVAQ